MYLINIFIFGLVVLIVHPSSYEFNCNTGVPTIRTLPMYAYLSWVSTQYFFLRVNLPKFPRNKAHKTVFFKLFIIVFYLYTFLTVWIKNYSYSFFPNHYQYLYLYLNPYYKRVVPSGSCVIWNCPKLEPQHWLNQITIYHSVYMYIYCIFKFADIYVFFYTCTVFSAINMAQSLQKVERHRCAQINNWKVVTTT